MRAAQLINFFNLAIPAHLPPASFCSSMPSRYFLWEPHTVEGQPCARLVLVLRGKMAMAPAKLAYLAFVKPNFLVSWTTFEKDLRSVQTGSRTPFHAATATELRVIRAHSTVPNKTHLSSLNLVSMSVLKRALLRRQVTPNAAPLQAAFEAFFRTGIGALRELPATQIIPQLAQVRNCIDAIPTFFLHRTTSSLTHPPSFVLL